MILMLNKELVAKQCHLISCCIVYDLLNLFACLFKMYFSMIVTLLGISTTVNIHLTADDVGIVLH